jgi:DNA polymerase-1
MKILLNELPPVTSAGDWICHDLEMFGLREGRIHVAGEGRFACLSTCTDGETVHVLTDQSRIEEWLYATRAGTWVCHKGDFDITHLRHWAMIPARVESYWDTMYIDRILWGGFFDRFNLAAVVRRYLNVYLDKDTQSEFQDAEALTDEMIQYSARDAMYTWQVAQEQRKKIKPEVLEDVWDKTDSPAFWALLDAKGFRLDVDAWLALAERNKAKQAEIDATIGFNPRSPKQVKEALVASGTNVPDTNEKTLNKLIRSIPHEEAARLAQLVLESRKYGKRASTYGVKFVEDHVFPEKDYFVVIASPKVTGAETGRMAYSDPNPQNIPSRDTKDFRMCFMARPGNKLISLDYGQQELRVAAYQSQDPTLIALFKSGGDLYLQIAEKWFGEAVDKDDPRRRQVKDLVLGTGYGLSAYGLAELWDISQDEAQEFLDEFFALFPVWKRHLDKMSRHSDYVETTIGRRVWLNEHNYQVYNNAKNSPVQGTAADMIKRAVGRIWSEWKFDAPYGLVAVVHDEVVLDVPEALAEKIGKFAQRIMIEVAEAMCPGVPFVADLSIVDRWGEKK